MAALVNSYGASGHVASRRVLNQDAANQDAVNQRAAGCSAATSKAGLQALAAGANVRLKLTFRGKALLVLAGSLLALSPFAVSLFGSVSSATASAEASAVDYGYIVALPGDSLWSIAERLDKTADPRDTVAELMHFNQLDTSAVSAYSAIAVPAKYADNPEVVTAAAAGLER